MANYDEEQEKGESGLDRAGEEAGRYGRDKAREKLSSKGAKEGAKEAGKDTAKQAVKEGGKKVGKEGTKRGLQAATAPETAGVGPAAIEIADQAQELARHPEETAKKVSIFIPAAIGAVVVVVVSVLVVVIGVPIVFLTALFGAVAIEESPPQEKPPIVGDGTGLLADYCIRMNVWPPPYPDAPIDEEKCSQKLRDLFIAAADWAKMPAGVLAGVASKEGPQMFGYTDAEIEDYSAPGAEDPYNNSVVGDGVCNPSSANAQGPMQFLPTTWDGGGDKYHEAVNIATEEGRTENICNIKDAIYAAAWLLKCNSGGVPPGECSSGKFTKYDWDDDNNGWEGPPGEEGEADGGPGEAYKAAAAYYWGDPTMANDCVDIIDGNPHNYCQAVWAYYQATKDSGTGGAPWGWPTSGTITQGPWEESHNGSDSAASSIDIADPVGTKIYATHDGWIEKPPEQPAGCGIYVIINGLTHITYYCHLQNYSPCVDAKIDGDQIKTGDFIGEIGITGDTSGPHLHYTIKDFTNNDIDINEFNTLVPPYRPPNVVSSSYSGSICQ